MSTTETLRDLQGRLNAVRDEAAKIVAEAGPNLDMDKVTSVEGDSAAKVAKFQSLQAEMSEIKEKMEPLEQQRASLEKLKSEVDSLGEIANPVVHPSAGTSRKARETEGKSLGQLFVESDALKGYKGGQGTIAHIDVDLMATTLTTTAGWAPYDFRSPRFVDAATRPIRVVDLIPQTTTDAAAISYMVETAFVNSAAEVSEGEAKPEGGLQFEERTDTVRKIAVWIPATDEQLADVPRLRGIIDNRLGFMVRQRLDSQILVGDGTAPNISGILDRTGLQTQALGGDTVPDAVYKAMTKVRTIAFSEPNAVIFHPNDWQTVRLLKTSDGAYLWGPPFDAGPERIWGIRVVQTTALTENTGLVGDFQQTELAVRQGVDVQVSNSHDDYFVKNLLAIRAEMRAALAVYRPAAFCSVTGI